MWYIFGYKQLLNLPKMPKSAKKSGKSTSKPRERPPHRPTKYAPKKLRDADAYYLECLKNEELLPTVEELALILEVAERTIYYWTKKHDDFLRTIKKIRTLQKLRLIHMGREKDRPIMELFLLKANHKLVEPTASSAAAERGVEMNLSISVTDETQNTQKARR